tara:strand:+ start:76 stop:1035 length:960 start_codon:yes stop_codon:yes gene_type:complete
LTGKIQIGSQSVIYAQAALVAGALLAGAIITTGHGNSIDKVLAQYHESNTQVLLQNQQIEQMKSDISNMQKQIAGIPEAIAKSDMLNTKISSAVSAAAIGAMAKVATVSNALPKEKAANNSPKNIETVKGGHPAIEPQDYVLGDRNAPVSIFEWADPECPYCKQFHGTPGKVAEKSNGKVNFVYRHLPLDFHGEIAVQESVAMECAGQQQGDAGFYKLVNSIYTGTRSNGKGPSVPVRSLANEAGLDMAAYDKCVGDQATKDLIDQDIKSAKHVRTASKGIAGTPSTVVINHATQNAILIRGAVSEQLLNQVVTAVQGG